jgi:hypothetical protein
MKNKKRSWQAYWQNTANDTFGTKFDSTNPIAQVLETEIGLANKHNAQVSTLLDLGSGKGEHFDWLKRVFSGDEKTTLQILGVDFAVGDIALDSNTQIIEDDFECLAQVSKLEASINTVFAMYAAEYSNFTKLLKALSDTTKKGCDCFFLMHTPTSVVSEKSKYTLDFYRIFLNQRCRKALVSFRKSKNTKLFENVILSELKKIAAMGREELMYDLQLVVNRLKSLFQTVDTKNIERHILLFNHYFDSLEQHSLRLKQQLNFAQNNENIFVELAKHYCEIRINKILQCEYGEVGRFVHFVLN